MSKPLQSEVGSRIAERSLPVSGIVIGVFLVLIPVVAMLAQGAAPRSPAGNDYFQSFVEVFSGSAFYTATLNTVIVGLFVTAFSTILGFSLAWICVRTDMPGRQIFETLNLVPFFLSPYVGAISWIYLAAPYAGLIQNTVLQLFGVEIGIPQIYSLGGVIFVLTLFYTPYIYLFVSAPLRQMDGALEDAVRVHGGSFLYTVRSVTIPLMMPALMSGALIVFVTSAGLFDVPMALATPEGIRMMPTEIFGLVQYPSDFGRAAAYGTLILVATILLSLLQRNYMDKRRFDTISGKGYSPRIIRLSGRYKIAALTLELVYLGCGVFLPILALVLVSFSGIWTGRFDPAFATLDNYEFVLLKDELTRVAIKNSLILALGGATIAVAIATLQAIYLQYRSGRSRSLVDAVLSLPLGVPGIILGLGFLIVAVRTPLYNTLTLILIAYIARFFPFATRNISSMVMAINPELEHSARCSGATWLQSIWHILIPLLAPALISAWIMLLVIFIRELGATMLLYTRGTETISVALILLSTRNTGYVAALGVLQIVLLLGAFALFRMLRVKNIET